MRRILTSLSLFVLLFASVSARAAEMFTYSYSGEGISGSGGFSLYAPVADGVYEVSSISGQVNGTAITSLLSVGAYNDNDNLFYDSETYLDENGVGFLLENGANVRIFYINGDWFFQGDGNFVLDGGNQGPSARTFSRGATETLLQLDYFTFGVNDVAQTPEPSSIVLLGTGVLGAAGAMRRRFVQA